MSDSQTTGAAGRSNSRTLLSSAQWLGILPAAVLAGWLGHRFGGVFLFLRNPSYPDFLFPLLSHLPSGLAFTFVGTLGGRAANPKSEAPNLKQIQNYKR